MVLCVQERESIITLHRRQQKAIENGYSASVMVCWSFLHYMGTIFDTTGGSFLCFIEIEDMSE